MKRPLFLGALAAASLVCLPASGERQLDRATRPLIPPAQAAVKSAPPASSLMTVRDYGKIPLSFIPNLGQTDSRVAFYVQGRDKIVYFTRAGLTIAMSKLENRYGYELSPGYLLRKKRGRIGGMFDGQSPSGPEPRERWAVRLDFVEANVAAGPVGLETSGAEFSYLKGATDEWKGRVSAYSRIAYRDLWPGIDLIYSGDFNRMKYEFVVRPGADPSRIRLAYRGARSVTVTPDGRLDVKTPLGGFQDDIPIAYQEIDGTKVDVPVAFAPNNSPEVRRARHLDDRTSPDADIEADPGRHAGTGPGRTGKTDPEADENPLDMAVFGYGFRLGDYDRSRTLVLDPVVLVYCGFVGGAGEEAARAIAVDPSGNVYLAGETSSPDLSFPGADGLDTTYNGGDADAFVAKLNPNGTALLFWTYLGGSGNDRAEGIAVDAAGNVYIAGFTDSTEETFPVLAGPDLTYNGGSSDAFVAKLSGTGSPLLYCGYIGGAGMDRAEGVDVDYEGNAYLTGFTDSTEATFPVVRAPDVTYNGGVSDAFVAVVVQTGAQLSSCGYIGGAGRDEAWGITCHDIASDMTGSPSQDDAVPFAIEIAGTTSSDDSTFPVLDGPDLTYNGGDSDAFVAAMSPEELSLLFCGYIGGSGTDEASGIASLVEYEWLDDIWGGGYMFFRPLICLTGTTSSTEETFPVVNGPDLTYNGGAADAFVAELSPPSTSLVYCGYIGGSGADVATAIACNRFHGWSGSGYLTLFLGVSVAGYTSSTEASFPVKCGPDPSYNGGASDAFVASVSSFGDRLLSCGFVGGAGTDEAWGIASSLENQDCVPDPATVDHPVYVAGLTSSTESSFPVTVGPDPTYNGGGSDAFVSRLRIIRPTLTAISPTSVNVGDPGFTMVVTGSGFLEGATVRWGGTYAGADLVTTFVSGTELRADITTDRLTRGQEAPIGVRNPDGGASDSLPFEVRNPAPSLTAVFPPKANAGGDGFHLAVIGSQFLTSATVLWNGSTRSTTYMSGTELQADISAEDIAQGGEVLVTVSNPAPTVGTSSAITFPVSSFKIESTPKTATVAAGQSATYTIQLTPQFGSFDAPVSFGCAGLPDQSTASFSPAVVTPGVATAATTLTIATKASSRSATAAVLGSPGNDPSLSAFLLIVIAVPVFVAFSLCRRLLQASPDRLLERWLSAAALVCLLIVGASCGAGGGDGDSGRTYQISVKGTSGGLSVTTSVSLIVK